MIRPPRGSTPFPYTTLFRSSYENSGGDQECDGERDEWPAPRSRRQKRNPLRFFDDRKSRRSESTRLNSSHSSISYAVFCLKKKNPRSPAAELLRGLKGSRRE